MPNYEVSKNVHLEKVRSVVQQYMMSPTNLTVFMFCRPCTSIYSFKEKPTWCTIYLQYISSNTSTRFGRT